MFINWDCKILSGTATFHKRGVLDCNFQNPSEIPGLIIHLYFKSNESAANINKDCLHTLLFSLITFSRGAT